jgi:hypothetical protein
MFQNFIVLILFLFLIRTVNKKLEKYIGYPLYTKMHEYIKDSKVLLYKKIYAIVKKNYLESGKNYFLLNHY